MKRKKYSKKKKLVCWNCGTTLKLVRAAKTPGATEYLVCNNGECGYQSPQFFKDSMSYKWIAIK